MAVKEGAAEGYGDGSVRGELSAREWKVFWGMNEWRHSRAEGLDHVNHA